MSAGRARNFPIGGDHFVPLAPECLCTSHIRAWAGLRQLYSEPGCCSARRLTVSDIRHRVTYPAPTSAGKQHPLVRLSSTAAHRHLPAVLICDVISTELSLDANTSAGQKRKTLYRVGHSGNPRSAVARFSCRDGLTVPQMRYKFSRSPCGFAFELLVRLPLRVPCAQRDDGGPLAH